MKNILENKALWKKTSIILFIIVIVLSFLLIKESKKKYYDFGDGIVIEKSDIIALTENIESGESFELCDIQNDKCISLIKVVEGNLQEGE